MRPTRAIFGHDRVLWCLHAPAEVGKRIIVPASISPTAPVKAVCFLKLRDRYPRILVTPLVTALCLRRRRKAAESYGDDDHTCKQVRVHPSLHACTGTCYSRAREALVSYFILGILYRFGPTC